jgi:P-type Mg2+ transporter
MLQEMQSIATGLSGQVAKERLIHYVANSLKQTRQSSGFNLLLNQFKSPIILILIVAAVLSIFLRDANSRIIFGVCQHSSQLWHGP